MNYVNGEISYPKSEGFPRLFLCQPIWATLKYPVDTIVIVLRFQYLICGM